MSDQGKQESESDRLARLNRERVRKYKQANRNKTKGDCRWCNRCQGYVAPNRWKFGYKLCDIHYDRPKEAPKCSVDDILGVSSKPKPTKTSKKKTTTTKVSEPPRFRVTAEMLNTEPQSVEQKEPKKRSIKKVVTKEKKARPPARRIKTKEQKKAETPEKAKSPGRPKKHMHHKTFYAKFKNSTKVDWDNYMRTGKTPE